MLTKITLFFILLNIFLLKKLIVSLVCGRELIIISNFFNSVEQTLMKNFYKKFSFL